MTPYCHTRPNLELNLGWVPACKSQLASWATEWYYYRQEPPGRQGAGDHINVWGPVSQLYWSDWILNPRYFVLVCPHPNFVLVWLHPYFVLVCPHTYFVSLSPHVFCVSLSLPVFCVSLFPPVFWFGLSPPIRILCICPGTNCHYSFGSTFFGGNILFGPNFFDPTFFLTWK